MPVPASLVFQIPQSTLLPSSKGGGRGASQGAARRGVCPLRWSGLEAGPTAPPRGEKLPSPSRTAQTYSPASAGRRPQNQATSLQPPEPGTPGRGPAQMSDWKCGEKTWQQFSRRYCREPFPKNSRITGIKHGGVVVLLSAGDSCRPSRNNSSPKPFFLWGYSSILPGDCGHAAHIFYFVGIWSRWSLTLH